jgi:vacuolar-type H+-ATPase subunit E/Vma4
MTADPHVNKLEEEILADARNKAERILARAQNDADKLRAEAEALIARKREERLREAEAIAETRAKAILVEVQQDIRRHWLLQREKCLDELLELALKQASQAAGEERTASLRGLAAEALQALGPVPCLVDIAPADAALVSPAWLLELARELFGPQTAVAFTVRPDPAIGGGLRFTALDQSRSFDNTYASRLRWMKTELRNLAARPT